MERSGRMRYRFVVLVLIALAPAGARAEIGDYPIRNVDRPLLLIPGLAEFTADASCSTSPSQYDAGGRVVRSADGSVIAAAGLMIAGRYGLFRDFEIGFRAPWTWARRLPPA